MDNSAGNKKEKQPAIIESWMRRREKRDIGNWKLQIANYGIKN